MGVESRVSGDDKIELARQWAQRFHAGQVDKLGRPYIDHVSDVAKRASVHGREAEIVAWLHDIVEDTPVTLAEIEESFGKAIRSGVDGMTRRADEDYFDVYLPRLQQSALARIVKLSDMQHNMAKLDGLHAVNPQDAKRLAEKYARAMAFLTVAVIHKEK
ncbi:HD domain-containing protein [Thalassospira marina]|uniref:Guanosine-3',5'-bis(Diphosphate) 3'-pyrophosphohydrolase n=1 Tax=Thalassospira marina TaxID=2048283 RepID=A0ABM6QB96_9PROT|nr:HD domain-containing protein [Thalassospira marina]AUG53845.1 guanosine-3',5'-bis(diphosphate) 3'-pyrophosphohydrolase [Thalassospira marina]